MSTLRGRGIGASSTSDLVIPDRWHRQVPVHLARVACKNCWISYSDTDLYLTDTRLANIAAVDPHNSAAFERVARVCGMTRLSESYAIGVDDGLMICDETPDMRMTRLIN